MTPTQTSKGRGDVPPTVAPDPGPSCPFPATTCDSLIRVLLGTPNASGPPLPQLGTAASPFSHHLQLHPPGETTIFPTCQTGPACRTGQARRHRQAKGARRCGSAGQEEGCGDDGAAWPRAGTDPERLLGDPVLHALQHVHVGMWPQVKANPEQKSQDGLWTRARGHVVQAFSAARGADSFWASQTDSHGGWAAPTPACAPGPCPRCSESEKQDRRCSRSRHTHAL